MTSAATVSGAVGGAPARPPAAEAPAPVEPARPGYRPDIDGLRAVAIGLVVAYHAHLPGFGAGFIGVDVFFALSGFLITRLVVAEIDTTGHLAVGTFWLRRARRLVPASAVMIATVVVVGQLVRSPLVWLQDLGDAVAGLFYVSNHHFAGRATDYFAEGVEASPFLHTWSLAVEEQFYVLWPLVFLVLARRSRHRDGLPRGVAGAVVAALSIASFLLAVRLTGQESPFAFFSALSRAWEFGAGALLALALGPGGIRSSRVRAGLRWGGVVLLVAGLVAIGPTTPFPGWATLLPVLATVALVASAPDRGVVGAVLTSPAAIGVGRLSYGWYLWHWPVIVLGVEVVGHDSPAVRSALAVASLAPAWVVLRLVEDPVRHSRRLAGSPQATLLVVAAVLTAGAAVVGAGWLRAERALDDPVVGALYEARHDNLTFDEDCVGTSAPLVRSRCVGGATDGDRLVLVLGDSHALHWIPGLDRATSDLGWRLTWSVLGNCPSLDVRWWQQTDRCTQRQAGLGGLVDDLAPDVVVVAHSPGYRSGLVGGDDEADGDALWRAALTDLASELDERDIGLLVVLATPRFDDDPLHCAVAAGTTEPCDLDADRVRARLAPWHELERRALADAGHGVTYDPTGRLCEAGRCPLAVDGLVRYSDLHHLTTAASETFGPDLARALEQAAFRPGGRGP